MADISHFVLRYYYFFEDELQPLERLADVLTSSSMLSCDSHTVPRFFNQQAMFYRLNCAQAKMMVLTVKTAQEDAPWSEGLRQLSEWEEQVGLSSDELIGKLTVLVANDRQWAELMEQACALLGCPDVISMGLEHGNLARLATDWNQGENYYLCGLDEFESASLQFLIRRLPLLHGSLIRLHMLDGILRDRDMAICQEKEELEKNLINILHSKLVMSQASLTATDELESEIEGLAGAYGMLVGDQKLIIDGIKRLDAQLGSIERQLANEPALDLPPALFQQLTDPYQERRKDLRNTHDELNIVREDYQAAIEVVQSKIDIMNSRTNIATQEQIKGLLEINTTMQKQSLIFQYAAGLIEFIVLAYYSHTLWSHLDHEAYLAIPGWIQFIVVFLFSGNTVMVTHLLAEYMQGEHHVRKKLIIATIPLVLIFLLVVAASILTGTHGAAH